MSEIKPDSTLNKKSPGPVPGGVAFHPYALNIPLLPDNFNRLLWVVGRCERAEWLCHVGDWVARGAPVCRFYVKSEFKMFSFRKEETHALEIVSPVDGLFLSQGQEFDSEGSQTYLFAIVPERSSTSPSTAKNVYQKFATSMLNCSHLLFNRKDETFLNEPPWLEEVLEELIQRPISKHSLTEYISNIDGLWREGVSSSVIEQLRHLETQGFENM